IGWLLSGVGLSFFAFLIVARGRKPRPPQQAVQNRQDVRQTKTGHLRAVLIGGGLLLGIILIGMVGIVRSLVGPSNSKHTITYNEWLAEHHYSQPSTATYNEWVEWITEQQNKALARSGSTTEVEPDSSAAVQATATPESAADLERDRSIEHQKQYL